MKNLKTISAVFMALSMMFVMGVTHATTLSFTNITNNGVTDLSSQLSVDITSDSNYAYFKFTNDVDSGIYSSITDIYFDFDTTLTSIAWSADSGAIYDPKTGKPISGVLFTDGASPGELPGGTTFTADYSADSDSPINEMGVNTSSEYITFMAALSSTFDYQNLMDAIFDGSFRIGMHIQAITDPACATPTDPDCGSDAYVNVNPVPVPAAAWLFGTALFGFFATSRRKKNS